MSNHSSLPNSSTQVFLVGAGPGDAGLLTLRAAELIQGADVVVYDRLVSKEILDMVPAGVARINVGKQPCSHPVPQHEINDLLVSLVREGRRVVRLKGGDPFMFGRGSEEALHLIRHGISFEVVPGVTAATGCSAAAGVPLTHRGLATGVRHVTGHCRESKELDLDWVGLTDAETTLVIYMGAANMAHIAVKLITHGRAHSTPAMAISNGTMPQQRHVISTLGEVANAAAESNLSSPLLFIVGEVVDLARQLGEDTVHEVVDFDLHAARMA